jgi:broad specificity phosphatase PhoE
LNADFVSIEDGTGIVHIAPTFGEEDYNVVAKFLGAENALEWLFMPVNEYGEFDEQVYDYTGESVLNINKTIIERLKEEKKLIKSESITHSYPHCWRCHTPLISKAMSSRFIKEQEMNANTLEAAETINFVPASVKNRFINGLQQAPDWNIARNRYRGSPLPIWQNVDDEDDRFSVGSLEEIYQLSRTGSKNIIKHIFIRHGQTDYNVAKKHDCVGSARLTAYGQQQAQEVKEKLIKLNIDKEQDLIIVISPLERTWQTIHPFLETRYSKDELTTTYQKYQTVQKQYQDLYNNGKLIAHTQDRTAQNQFEIGKNLYVDFRITDLIVPSIQDKEMPLPFTKDEQTFDEPYYGDGESINQLIQRDKNYINEMSEKYPTKTIMTVSHG